MEGPPNFYSEEYYDIFKLIYDDSMPLLSRAALAGDLELIEKLLRSGKLPQTPDYRGFTSLHCCVAANQFEALKLILRVKAKNKKYLVNLKTWDNLSPLFIALSYSPKQSLEIIKCLLEAGANPNICSYLNLSPLHLASSKKGNLELVKLLHSYGADVNIREDLSCFTPLHCAIAKAKDLKMVEYLLEYSTLGCLNYYGRTEFLEACNSQFMEAVKLFIQKDKKLVNTFEPQCSTALAIAALHGNMELVQLLLENGADMNMTCRVYVEACDDDGDIVEVHFDRHLPIHSGLKNLDIFKLFLKFTDPKAIDVPLEYYSFPSHVLLFGKDTSYIEEVLVSNLPDNLRLINSTDIVKFVRVFVNLTTLFSNKLHLFFKYNFSLEPDLVFNDLCSLFPDELEELPRRYKFVLKLAQMGLSANQSYNKVIVISLFESVIDKHPDPEGVRLTCNLLQQSMLSLKQMCRIAVRRHIKSWLEDDLLVAKYVQESGLPFNLKEYLFFKTN